MRVGLACALTAAFALVSCTRERITAVDIAAVTVTPPDATLLAGDSLQLSAFVRGPDGRTYSNAEVVWASEDTTVARVGPTGRVQGRSAGSVFVTATFGDVSGTSFVRVFPGPAIGVSRSLVEIAAVADGPPPAVELVTVFNAGAGLITGLQASVEYPQGSGAGWLQASLSGTTAPAVLSLTAEPHLLPNGVHEAIVVVSAEGTDDVEVAVRLTLAGFAVMETGGSTSVSETGTSDSLHVVLTSPPTSNVVLHVIPSDAGEVSVSPSSLTFTPDDWNVAQTIVVTGVDDPVADGSQAVTLRVSVDDGASDDDFDALADRTVLVTNDDDDQAGFEVLETGGGTAVSEVGGTDSLLVVLTTQPMTPVVLTVAASDPTEVNVTPTTVTFTSANWSTPQAITVTGVDDALQDGDQTSEVRVSVNAAASDDAFDALTDRAVAVTTLDDDQADFLIDESGGSTSVSESGTTDTFTVVLATRPLSNVVFRVTSSDPGEATAAPPTLTFTPDSWNVPQVVTVTGVDDAVVDGEQTSTIIVAVDDLASDDAFDPLPDAIVSVATADDDQAGFTVGETGGSTSVSESGTTDAITVVLTMAPVLDVVFDVTASDPSEAVVAPATLTFTSANWNVPQTVTVTGVDDPVVDGNQSSTVRISVNDAASDNAFDPLADRTVTVTTVDDDVAGFTVVETDGGTSVSESGTTDTFSVVLTAQPSSNVVLELVASDAGEATIVPTSLTFTSANWNLPQTVTVTGVDDPVVDGSQVSTVRVSIHQEASDDAFDPVADRFVSVVTVDDDLAAYSVVETGGSTLVTELGTSDVLVVVLSTQPSSNVVFDVMASDTTEAVASPRMLTFTPANWSEPQIVTVTGVDDAIVDGPQTSTITVSVNDALSDDAFDGLADRVINVSTADDDVVQIIVLESDGSTIVSEAATRRDTVSVALSDRPAGRVVLTITSSDTGEANVAPTSLTFTAANWSTPQLLIVSGVYDLVLDGDQLVTLTISVNDALSDDAFDDVPDRAVVVRVLDSLLPL